MLLPQFGQYFLSTGAAVNVGCDPIEYEDLADSPDLSSCEIAPSTVTFTMLAYRPIVAIRTLRKDSDEERGQKGRRIRRYSRRVRNNPSKSATSDQYCDYSSDDRPDNAPEKYDDAPTERKTPPDHDACPNPRRSPC